MTLGILPFVLSGGMALVRFGGCALSDRAGEGSTYGRCGARDVVVLCGFGYSRAADGVALSGGDSELLGFDYLGDTLADQGFVVVSLGVNGIDAAHPGGACRDRARLVNEHLRLWRDLVRTGGWGVGGEVCRSGYRRSGRG